MAANTDGAAAATAPPQVRNPYQSTTTDTNTIAAIVHSLGRSNNTVKNDKPAWIVSLIRLYVSDRHMVVYSIGATCSLYVYAN